MKRDNPYVGPRTFEEGDSDVFFGREQEASNLLSLVVSQRLVLFYAQSGAGKSSLINTRLIPGLRQEQFMVLPVGRVGGAVPEGIHDIKNVFVFNLIMSLEAKQAAQELADLSLTVYLQRRRERENQQETPYVLIVDQFEEIVTTNLGRWQEREDFFTQLRQAIKDDPYLWVVLTIREDYLAALDPYASILPNKLRVRFHMQRMKAEAALEAIEIPAQLGERPFAPDVAQILVDNLRQIRSQDVGIGKIRLGEYIEPVQLQVVCYQLWENLKSQAKMLVTAEDLLELGNVDAALAQFYEDALVAVVKATNISEIDLRNWFENEVITETHTRGAVYQGLVETAGLSNQTVRLLANRYLLRAEIRSGGVWYELVHDRFIGPILQSNQRWRFKQSALVQAALAWQEAGKDPAYLHTGQHLTEILEDVDRESQEQIVKEFIAASEKEDRAVEARVNMRQHLAEARLQLEERGRVEARLRSRAIGLSISLVVLTIYACFITFFAVSNFSLGIMATQNTTTLVSNSLVPPTITSTETPFIDSMATTTAEWCSKDHDGDTLLNCEELDVYKTNPLLTDSDSDGLPDNFEVLMWQTNPRDVDSDADGLFDGEEVNYRCFISPNNPDTDGDELNDGAEVYSGTDPCSPSTPTMPPPTPALTPMPFIDFAFGGQINDIVNLGVANAAGMDWIKMQVHFSLGDNPAEITQGLQEINDEGFKVLVTVVGDKEELILGGNDYYQQYAEFVAGLATLVDAIEIWSEPNTSADGMGIITASEYSHLLAESYIMVKRTNPDVMVISAGLYPTDKFIDSGWCYTSGNGCNDNRYLSEMYASGVKNYIDCLGMHFNTGATWPSQREYHPGDSGDRHYSWYFWPIIEFYWNTFNPLEDVINSYIVPLCFTELGYLSADGFEETLAQIGAIDFLWAEGVTQQYQALWLSDALLKARCSGQVKMLVVWNIDYTNYGSNPQAGYAILRPDNTCPACNYLSTTAFQACGS